MTISIRMFNEREETITSKEGAKNVLEKIILKQGFLNFPHADNEAYRFQISASNLKSDKAGNIVDPKPIEELTDKEKMISFLSYDVKDADNPFALISTGYSFDDAVKELYRIRRHYNAYRSH